MHRSTPPPPRLVQLLKFSEICYINWCSCGYWHCMTMHGTNCHLCLDKSSKYKTTACLPDKQAVTAAGLNLGFNTKSLLDWHNFDLPKLMPTEHISTDTCIIVVYYVKKILITAQPIRNLQTPATAEEKNRELLNIRYSFPFLTNPLSHFPSLTLLFDTCYAG